MTHEKDILDNFIDSAKKSILDGYYETATRYHGKHVSLAEKLKANKFTLICEIKHASPAGEYSFDSIDVKKTARDFAECGADAISVVVEPKIFKGHLDNVTTAKEAGLPVLFKDFVISKEQIAAAANVGADAVLIVAKAAQRMNLDLSDLIFEAHRHGLEVLLEAYDENEMKLAAKTEADIIGINNRDLRTLKVDLNRTANILRAAGKVGKPVISESGIRGAEDVKFLRQFGVSGVLVGTAIWKAPDLRAKVSELKSAAL